MPVLSRRLVAPLLLGLASVGPLAAQEAPPEGLPALPTFAARGSGTLAVDESTRPLPFAITGAGPLVAIAPVVARLGGQLEIGPLGQSYTLRLGDLAAVLAPLAASLTRGEEILALSQAPVVLDGELLVPIDLLEETFGAALGVELAWQGEGQRLVVTRPQRRELPLTVDLVHVQGTSTLVLGFPDRPRYRLRPRAGGYDLELVGDRVVPPARRDLADPLVRAVTVEPERLRIDLVEGASAESYELREPFRIVFDIVRASRDAAAAAPIAPRRPGREVRTIVLDPGHGGAETGATGPAGTFEKDLTLVIALQLRAKLEEQLGARVVLTRTSDVDLDLDHRAAIANQNQADLFLSIHLNSTRRGGARGAETYFLSLQASDQRAAAVAVDENLVGAAPAGDEPIDPDLQLILWDLAQSQHLAASQRLATLIQEELNTQLDLRDRGVKQAPFRVLMGASMPAVLVELGFLSTREEEESLRLPAYRAGLADALVRAVGRFKAEREGGGEPPPAPAAPPGPPS